MLVQQEPRGSRVREAPMETKVPPGIWDYRVPLARKGHRVLQVLPEIKALQDRLAQQGQWDPRAQMGFPVLREARVLMVIKVHKAMPAQAPRGPLALKVP